MINSPAVLSYYRMYRSVYASSPGIRRSFRPQTTEKHSALLHYLGAPPLLPADSLHLELSALIAFLSSASGFQNLLTFSPSVSSMEPSLLWHLLTSGSSDVHLCRCCLKGSSSSNGTGCPSLNTHRKRDSPGVILLPELS